MWTGREALASGCRHLLPLLLGAGVQPQETDTQTRPGHAFAPPGFLNSSRLLVQDWRQCWGWGKADGGLNPALPGGCMTGGQSLHLSGPQLPYSKRGIME